MKSPIRVVVVEDSPVIREFLIEILNSDPGITVVGAAADGEEALGLVLREKPDIVTMDINMPKLNGFEATRQIMAARPTPIIIVSGSMKSKEVATAFLAIEAGAVSLLPRPAGIGHPEFESTSRQLLEKVKLMAEIKVVRRWRSSASEPAAKTPVQRVNPLRVCFEPKVVAIGASTGGPGILQSILKDLPADFPVPILLVQHIAKGFTAGFAQWLGASSPLGVRVAQENDLLLPGHVYVAPDRIHMGVNRHNRIQFGGCAEINGVCPSVSYLFQRTQEAYGGQVLAILLSGMGKDGAKELKELRDRGACTVAQDKESCIVHGMPGEAIRLGGAMHVLSPAEITALLLSVSRKE